jgi:hypothetical protein
MRFNLTIDLGVQLSPPRFSNAKEMIFHPGTSGYSDHKPM